MNYPNHPSNGLPHQDSYAVSSTQATNTQHPNGAMYPQDWRYGIPAQQQSQQPVLPPPQHMPSMSTPSLPATYHYTMPQQVQQMTPQQLPAPGPSAPTQTQAGPSSYSGQRGKYRYRLEVIQQPQRARMCGFGDKDRRPITPPPCVKLIIEDIETGKTVSAADLDGSYFVLQVDLWDEHGQREVNIVRASGSSPATSISAATTTSYPPPPDRPPMAAQYGQAMQMYQGPDGAYYQHPVGGMVYDPTTGYAQPQYGGYQQQQQSMITRNLIGSLVVNAQKLSAPNEKGAFWFVLQDLSVRTEGWFRLKMSFIDLGSPTHAGTLNKGRAQILASEYSAKFQVFSAKKFPGVIESTPLSKEFAKQGIKIPIRKDGTKNEAKDEDDE